MYRTHVSICLAVLLSFATNHAGAAEFRLRSKSLKNGQAIPADYFWNNFGCTGKNVMPDLEWSGAPFGTRSFAITVYDKDAPTGSGFWHWVAYDIPVAVTSLAGGVDGGLMPAGIVQGNTDMGKPGFLGPCPPVGQKHRYFFTVHALKVEKLPVDQGVSPAMVGFTLWQNRIGKAEFQVTAGPRK